MLEAPRTGGRVVDCSGLENPDQKPPETPQSADFCGSEHAQDALFTNRSTHGEDTRVGTSATLTRKQEALQSVRRLIRTGNNKSYWRKREASILTEIDHLKAEGAA